MGRLATYTEPTEQKYFSSCSSSPSHDGHTDDTKKSGTKVTNLTTEELPTSQSGLERLSSMNRMNIFTKLGSQNNYDEQTQKGRQPSSDTTHAARIFSTHHQNSCGPSITNHGEDEVVVKIDEPLTSNATTKGAARGREAFSNGANAAREGGRRECSRPGENVVERSPFNEVLPLREVDSFDDLEQFQRTSSVSITEISSSTGSSPPNAGPVPGATSPQLPRFPKVLATGCRKVDGEVRTGVQGVPELGIQHRGTYNFRKDKVLPGGSFSRESSGSDFNFSSSKLSRRKENSFDFGIIPEADPPTKLIGAFLRRQTESGSNFLDLDLDMDELTPSPKLPNDDRSSPRSDLEEQSPSPPINPLVKDSSYGDLCRLDLVTASVPTSFKAGAQSPPSSGEFRASKDQVPKYNSDPLLFPEEAKQDVTINMGGDERYVKGMEQLAAGAAAASAFKSSSAQDGNAAGIDSSGGAGVRWRRNGSFRPTSPQMSTAEVEVLKAPVQYVSRPSFSRQKSRLADIPKPPEFDDKGGQIKSGQARNSGQLKSGLVGNKLKKVQEEEEEDPLKVTDMPEKFHKRDKGFWNIFQWLAFLCITGGLITVLAFPSLRETKRRGLMLWKWGLLVMVVFSGRLISGFIIWIVVFIIEKNFLLRKRVVYFVYALRKGVQNCLWLGFALLAWHLMIDPKVDKNIRAVRYVSKVLVCFLVAAVIVLVKTLIVKVFASSFHVNNYFERIQEALFNQYIMETLAGPPMIEFQQNFEEDKKLIEEIAGLRDAGASGPSLSKVPDLPAINLKRTSGLPARQSLNLNSGMMGTQSGMIGKSPKAAEVKNKSKNQAELNEGISVEHLQRLDISNISAWNMKRLMHIVKHSTLTHSLEETVNAEGLETEIQSEWQAKVAAKQIFRNVAKPRQKVIMEDDLLRFMREEETKKALPLFDGAVEKKCITKQALKNWVISVYRERRALALSLNDTKTAVNKLHRMVDVVVGIIILIIWLLLLGIATTKLLLFMSSQILLLILVWGNTLKTVFEAIVFLFVMHPFDVGDRCVIDGMQLVVEEMNILTTVFIGDFNVKVWWPNSVLATKPIQNYYRSPEMGDGVEFIVQASTPVEKIASFKEKIGRYIASKPHHWHQDYSLNVLQMTEGERMKLSLGVKHTMNYQDMGEIVKRRSDLLLEVKFCLRELCIEYHIPAQEVLLRQQTN